MTDGSTRLGAMGVKRADEEVPVSTGGTTNLTFGRPRQLASCQDIGWRDGVRFEVTKNLRRSNFCSFIEGNSQEDVVGFFREVAREMEEKRGILDFHMKIKEERPRRFCVQVFFGDHDQKNPEATVESGECI